MEGALMPRRLMTQAAAGAGAGSTRARDGRNAAAMSAPAGGGRGGGGRGRGGGGPAAIGVVVPTAPTNAWFEDAMSSPPADPMWPATSWAAPTLSVAAAGAPSMPDAYALLMIEPSTAT